MTTADTVRQVIDVLHAETLKRGEVAAIKAAVIGLHGRELRLALKTVAYYERALNRAVLDFYRDDIDAGEFIDEMVRLIEGQFERAWNEGSREAGIDPQTHSEDDDAELQQRIDKELDFVLDYAEAIEKARIEGAPVGPLQDRVTLWANRYNEVVNEAKIYFGKQLRFEWVYGDTDHCDTCIELNGIVATGETWEESDWQPQGSNLDCGGWRCQCTLQPTKKPVTDKQPGDVQAK